MSGQVQEARILLRRCAPVTREQAGERLVTSKNIKRWRSRFPSRDIRLHEWIPYEPADGGIDAYIESGGYSALRKALGMRPGDVVEAIAESQLLGRGGAGFPTGVKWRLAAAQTGGEKFFVCNAEEGEPGTFKDKVLLEQDPHQVLEGMAIGAYATGCSEGFIFIKGEYGAAAQRVMQAVREAESKGLLGVGIGGSAFSFRVRVVRSVGGYVCGEETALLRALEGRRAVPQAKPPFPTIAGLNRRPTVINNVETLAYVPHIIDKGPAWFRGLGVEGSYGTKLFCISGNVANAGLYEIELGSCTLGDLIFHFGGGIEGGKALKAVLPGGVSTSFLTAQDLDVRMDYDSLHRAGSSLGTGAVLVFDQTVSIPDVVKGLFDFFASESCGHCTPCRIGTRIARDLLARITGPVGIDELANFRSRGGPRAAGLLDKLEALGATLKAAAKCGLGQAAPCPLLSSLERFREEYTMLIERRQAEYDRIVDHWPGAEARKAKVRARRQDS